MFTAMRNWGARRRLAIRVHLGAEASEVLQIAVVNRSGRPVTIDQVAISWPYRRVRPWRRVKAALRHGHHWRTIGWTHHRLPEIDEALLLPTTLKPGQALDFELPLTAARGTWEGDRLIFVIRVRDTRGRHYYSRACNLHARRTGN